MHESLLVPWQPSVHGNTRWHQETGLFHFTATQRGLKTAAEAAVRAAGPTWPEQADEEKPGYLPAREWDIYMCKTLTYSPGSTGTAKASAALCL